MRSTSRACDQLQCPAGRGGAAGTFFPKLEKMNQLRNIYSWLVHFSKSSGGAGRGAALHRPQWRKRKGQGTKQGTSTARATFAPFTICETQHKNVLVSENPRHLDRQTRSMFPANRGISVGYRHADISMSSGRLVLRGGKGTALPLWQGRHAGKPGMCNPHTTQRCLVLDPLLQHRRMQHVSCP